MTATAKPPCRECKEGSYHDTQCSLNCPTLGYRSAVLDSERTAPASTPQTGEVNSEPRHAFARYKNRRTDYCGEPLNYGARCGRLADHPVHLSDDIVDDDRQVPFEAASTPGEVAQGPRCVVCGHHSAFGNLNTGVCQAIIREDDNGPVYCGHVCTFPAEAAQTELSQCCNAKLRLYTADLSPYYVCSKCHHFIRDFRAEATAESHTFIPTGTSSCGFPSCKLSRHPTEATAEVSDDSTNESSQATHSATGDVNA